MYFFIFGVPCIKSRGTKILGHELIRNFVARNKNMGNPQEMMAFIYDWLEPCINIIHLTITKIR